MELGCIVDQQRDKVAGFWDLLSKKCVLLTATMNRNMQEMLYYAYGLYNPDFLRFDDVIKQSDSNACKPEITYSVLQTQQDYWDRLDKIVTE